MSANQLKKLLIGKIADTEDEELLTAVYKLLDYHSSSGAVYGLNENEKKAVEEGQRQIREGLTVSNEELEREIDQWLSE